MHLGDDASCGGWCTACPVMPCSHKPRAPPDVGHPLLPCGGETPAALAGEPLFAFLPCVSLQPYDLPTCPAAEPPPQLQQLQQQLCFWQASALHSCCNQARQAHRRAGCGCCCWAEGLCWAPAAAVLPAPDAGLAAFAATLSVQQPAAASGCWRRRCSTGLESPQTCRNRKLLLSDWRMGTWPHSLLHHPTAAG